MSQFLIKFHEEVGEVESLKFPASGVPYVSEPGTYTPSFVPMRRKLQMHNNT
jgi:hypothetical protein